MKKISTILFLSFSCCLIGSRAGAQTPTDAIMMEKGQICFAALYGHNTWHEYWEGTLKRENGNIGTLTSQSITPMFALGVINRVNLLAGINWMKTDASAGQVRGAKGLQDWGVWLKGEVFKIPTGPGKLSFDAVAGISGPASNYLPDFAPFSLGLGCPDGSLRGIFQYELEKGPYARVQAGYHLRGSCTIERDYYYSDQDYYTDKVDVPNAVTYEAVLGSWFLNYALKVQASFDGLQSLSGNDIRRQDAGFPSNKMIFTCVGGLVQYYFPFVKGLGVLASGNYVLSGRNVGQSLGITGGVTYQFGIWNRTKMETESKK